MTQPTLQDDTPQPTEARMTLAQFCAEAKRIGLTADVFAAQLATRPEFADCVAPPKNPAP